MSSDTARAYKQLAMRARDAAREAIDQRCLAEAREWIDLSIIAESAARDPVVVCDMETST